jgi:membrane-associated phospholipid phosphatase
MKRRNFLACLLSLAALPAPAQSSKATTDTILRTWYRLIIELVRHTPTYSPPVASRAFSYIGVTAYEALCPVTGGYVSLTGQLNGLTALPAAEASPVDAAVVLQTALATVVLALFGNTGPTGQRAVAALSEQLGTQAADGIPSDIAAASVARGKAIATHILDWAQADGGAVVENMGFPASYTVGGQPQDWVPTSRVAQQQVPLLPNWGKNRPFAMPAGNACPLPAPPDYSEDPTSPFYAAAAEVHDIVGNLTDEQRLIARFWSDDPMLSPTPPGHWIAIALGISERDGLSAERTADILARLGIAMADAFIGCWHTKYEYNLLRPITYIRRFISPEWEPLLNTPPFPEYPSGHSTQSAAAAAVLTAALGEDFAFEDMTHEDEGLPVRSFDSFWQAAEEAAISRLYGGIHYRFGVEAGIAQGRCIGAYAANLRTGV